MERDPLEQWVRHADRTAGKPMLSPGLADRVRRTHRARRRKARTFVACLGLFMLASIGTRQFMRARNASQAPPVAIVAASQDQRIDDLTAQVNQLQQEITSLRQASETRVRVSDRREIEPVDGRADELERAALLIVYQADRYYHELGMREPAVASYRQIIESFPQTSAAQTARARLTELQKNHGDRS